MSHGKGEQGGMTIKTVGVVGCGLMGSGIAQVSAEAGYRVVVREVNDSLVKKGIGRIDAFLAKGVERGKVSPERRAEVMSRLEGTTAFEALAACDIVIEAAVENLEAKADAYRALDAVCPPQTIFASNTSSLSITEMAAMTKRPARFVGLHFFNPVPLMKLVEVIRALTTSDDTYRTAFAFAQSLGKEPITAPDRPGFIVNRLLVPYLLDAIRAYENGLGTLEDIDTGMKLGCGYPMGPFTLLDFVGLDTTYYIANIMFEEFREPAYAPPPLLKRMVLAGRLGRKSGEGFYKY
jgi:3-hydroxybutyryl-CoA dehydrogenase